MLKKYAILFSLLIALLLLFENRNIPINKKSYFGNDVRRFQCTKAWNLAKAVEDQNVWEIERQVRLLKVPVDCRDRINKFTPLMYAVYANKIRSVKTLLDLGANPNLPNDTICSSGENAVIISSCSFYTSSADVLRLLLKYGGNPNSIQHGKKLDNSGNWELARCTALGLAVPSTGDYEKVRILVDAGADVNYRDGGVSCEALENALLLDRMDVALYLLEHGADYTRKFCVIDESNTTCYVDILYMLRLNVFPLDSPEYRDKLKIVTFLKNKGMDYWKSPIPDRIPKVVQRIFGSMTDVELQEFVKRY